MHNQHVTQCTTLANMHSHMGGVFRKKKKFDNDANQTENFIGAKTENDLYYRGRKTLLTLKNIWEHT